MSMQSPPEQEHKKSQVFDPDKGFLDLLIVQISLALIFFACLVIACKMTQGWGFEFTADGFRTAASLFRIPVGVFTLSLPVFALLAASHRSEQTKQQMSLTRHQIARTDKQIGLASEQNNFSNFYKHMEEFGKYCDLHSKTEAYRVQSVRRLHAKLFPRAREGDLTLDTDVARTLTDKIAQFVDTCKHLGNADHRMGAIYTIRLEQHTLSKTYFLTENKEIENKWFYNEIPFHMPDETANGFIRHHLSLFLLLDEACRFDTSYETPLLLRCLAKSSLGCIPSQPLNVCDEFDTSCMTEDERDLDYMSRK